MRQLTITFLVASFLLGSFATIVFAEPPRQRCSIHSVTAPSVTEALRKIMNRSGAPPAPFGSPTPTTAAGLPGTASIESMLIEGLTRFVIKRARQEAIAFVLDAVQKKVCGHKDAASLFQRTCAMFKAADEASTAVVPGRSFQDAIINDLRAIPWRLADHIDAKIATIPDPATAKKLALVLRVADDVACGIERRQSPLPLAAEVLKRYWADLGIPKDFEPAIRIVAGILANATAAEIDAWLAEPERFGRVVRATVRGVVLEELRDAFKLAETHVRKTLPPNATLLREAFDVVWLTLPQVLEAGTSAQAIEALRKGLVELRVRAAALTGELSAQLKPVVEDIIKLSEYVFALLDNPLTAPSLIAALPEILTRFDEHLEKLAQAARAKGGDEWLAVAAIADQLRSAVGGLAAAPPWADELNKAEAAYEKYVAPAVPHALALYGAIRSYRAATDDASRRAALRNVLEAAISMFEQIIVPNLCPAAAPDCDAARVASEALVAARAFLSGDYAVAIRSLVDVLALTKLGDSPAFVEIKRFGTLFADIAGAKSSDEIVVALETAAAPLGSWRLRRKKTTYGLSARVGFAIGGERIDRDDTMNNVGGTFGLHIPIVLDYWWPGSSEGYAPLGLGIQLLDLGGIASVGFGADDTKVEPDAGFAEVLAPGLTGSVGLGKTPFVLAVTGAWSPALRESETMDESYGVWRLLVSLSVDVPIFMW